MEEGGAGRIEARHCVGPSHTTQDGNVCHVHFSPSSELRWPASLLSPCLSYLHCFSGIYKGWGLGLGTLVKGVNAWLVEVAIQAITRRQVGRSHLRYHYFFFRLIFLYERNDSPFPSSLFVHEGERRWEEVGASDGERGGRHVGISCLIESSAGVQALGLPPPDAGDTLSGELCHVCPPPRGREMKEGEGIGGDGREERDYLLLVFLPHYLIFFFLSDFLCFFILFCPALFCVIIFLYFLFLSSFLSYYFVFCFLSLFFFSSFS